MKRLLNLHGKDRLMDTPLQTLDRREFLRLSGAAAAGILSGGSFLSLSGGGKHPPNILFIIGDDLRPELGCYGNTAVKSPNIDRLASQGVVFCRSYCQQSICNPSRSSFLTGMRPDSIKVWDQVTHFRKHQPDLMTLPQYFKENGYHSVGIGKVFHDFAKDPVSWSCPSPEIKGAYIFQNPGTRNLLKKLEDRARALGKSRTWIMTMLRGPATEAFDAPESQYWDGALTDQAIQLLGELKDKEPFFLAMGFFKPHLPFVAPKKYWDIYNPDEIPLAKNNFPPKGAPFFALNEGYELANYEGFINIPKPTEGALTRLQARLLKHGYYACISFIDAQIGRLLDELERLELRENTIIVLLGDQGCKLGEHRCWGKRTNYENDIRTTLIVSAPEAPANGKVSPALVELVDVYPTLCELAGLEVPSHLEGTSMVPLLKKPDRTWKIAAFSQSVRGFSGRFLGRSIRMDRYHYVEWKDWIKGEIIARELYDHQNDPEENLNIADWPEHRQLIQRLSYLLSVGWKGVLPRRSLKK